MRAADFHVEPIVLQVCCRCKRGIYIVLECAFIDTRRTSPLDSASSEIIREDLVPETRTYSAMLIPYGSRFRRTKPK